jgi:hypothetical protein
VYFYLFLYIGVHIASYRETYHPDNKFFRRSSPCFTSPCFTSPCFTSPCFTSPCFTSPCFTSPYFTSPCFTSPCVTNPVHSLQVQSSPRSSPCFTTCLQFQGRPNRYHYDQDQMSTFHVIYSCCTGMWDFTWLYVVYIILDSVINIQK